MSLTFASDSAAGAARDTETNSLAGLANAVAVPVGLVRVRDPVAVVDGVQDAIAVPIGVADITDAVVIEVVLPLVRVVGAVVGVVVDAVSVAVVF